MKAGFPEKAALLGILPALVSSGCKKAPDPIAGFYVGAIVLGPKMQASYGSGGATGERIMEGYKSEKSTLDLRKDYTFTLDNDSQDGDTKTTGTWTRTGDEIETKGDSVSLDGSELQDMRGNPVTKLKIGSDGKLTLENPNPSPTIDVTTTYTRSLGGPK
jgi:hypothetical protein